MALQRITFRPGINKQLTPTLNEGGWSDGNRVRFRDGMPQPIGGWKKQFVTTFPGVCRKLHAWVSLAGQRQLALGTSSQLLIAQSDALYDITPPRGTAALVNPFTTTTGSQTVTVAAPGHGMAVGDGVVLSVASLASLLIFGVYQAVSVIDANHFTITVAGTANASISGGGSVTATYLLNVGHVDVPFGSGFGAGAFGKGTFGTSRTGLVQAGNLRLWSLDNWGEELVACPRGGSIYNWKPSGGVTTRAAAIAGAPTAALGVMTGLPERHLIAFLPGMTVAWSDVENYNVWTATATNSAGSFPLVGGSEIRCWAAAQGEILIWTDTALWAMRFQGLPTVYGFYQQATGCGAISANAATTLDGSAYWMGTQGFFRYSGQVLPVPCDVWDAVFLNLNTRQAAKIHCGRNMGWNEITWFYPSAASNEIDRYVTLDVVNGRWSLGSLRRTAWIDAGPFDTPLAANPDYPGVTGGPSSPSDPVQVLFPVGGNTVVPTSTVYAHEFGDTDDGQPLGDVAESGFFDIGDGAEISFVDEIIPDFADLSGTVLITIKAQMFPNGAVRTKGPFAVTNTTRHISPRIRGRQLALRIESSGSGSFYRLGALRARIAPDGRK